MKQVIVDFIVLEHRYYQHPVALVQVRDCIHLLVDEDLRVSFLYTEYVPKDEKPKEYYLMVSPEARVAWIVRIIDRKKLEVVKKIEVWQD